MNRVGTMRRLRNDRSHPKKMMLLDPMQSAGLLDCCAELINKLYPDTASQATEANVKPIDSE